MNSVLTKNQKQSKRKKYTENGHAYLIKVNLRYDDECGDGHNTFNITGEMYEKNHCGNWKKFRFGCCHDEIMKHFPEYEHLIKWHLCSSDGPLHYVTNTVYHAQHHGPNRCHIEFKDEKNNLHTSSLKYCDLEEGQKIVDSHPDLYTMRIDEKTAKTADLDAARHCAIWPDATDEELLSDDLKEKLKARLPGLLTEFRTVIENLGFVY